MKRISRLHRHHHGLSSLPSARPTFCQLYPSLYNPAEISRNFQFTTATAQQQRSPKKGKYKPGKNKSNASNTSQTSTTTRATNLLSKFHPKSFFIPLRSLMTNYQRGSVTIFGYHITRWTLRVWVPRIFLAVWALAFATAGLYTLVKSIETEGFTATQNAGSGGDVNQSSWEMVDHNGKTITKELFLGKYTLIYFGFTFCPDVCPIEMKKMAEIADILKTRGLLDTELTIGDKENKNNKNDKKKSKNKGGKVVPVFVSVDFKRDSPKVVKKYVNEYSDKIYGLCGNQKQLEHFARVMKTYFSKPPSMEEDYILEHSTYMYFTDTNGQFMHLTRTDDGAELLADKIAMWIAEDQGTISKYVEKTKQFLR